jgi:hypothetical protein
MAHFEEEEKRILDALGEKLLREYPNPERFGCPPPKVLKDIAFHNLTFANAERWFEHITACSPCYREYCDLRDVQKRRRKQMVLLAVACILVVILGAGRILTQRYKQIHDVAVLDLRDRSMTRGDAPDLGSNTGEVALQANRSASHWTIYLPRNIAASGPYEVRLLTRSGELLFNESTAAKVLESASAIQVRVHVSSVSPGLYVLQVRATGSEWESYPVTLQ